MAEKQRVAGRSNTEFIKPANEFHRNDAEDPDGKGNVTVVCRFRPLNQKEKDMNEKMCIEFGPDLKTVSIKSLYEGMTPLSFNFDRVFNSDSLQKDVYEVAARPIVESVLEGFNGTVLTYGQTSSGKTHTMTGPDIDDPENRGIIPRMVKTVFQHIEDADDHLEFTVKVGYCEIYLEKIRDLLFPEKQNLKISEDKARGVYIADLTEEYVTKDEEIYNLMKLGTKNREVGATNMNEGSSRSHAIFMLTVIQSNTRDLSAKSGKLYLVDLAGSEKVGKTGAEGKRLDEAKNINKSLSALGLVIFSLTDGKSTHVPYRDSKLTRVLQDSLGGNSKTSLIITCSPANYNEQETLSTLRFGVRAKAIKNKPKVNKEYSVAELKMLLNQANEAILKKDSRITWLEKHFVELGGVIPSSIDQDESKEESLASTQEYQEVLMVLENERQKLADEMELTSVIKKDLSTLSSKNASLARENDNLNSKLMTLLMTIQEIEDKLQDSLEDNQKLQTKNESLAKQIINLEQSIKNSEKKIEEQRLEISRIPIDYVPVHERDSLLKEIEDLRSRYRSQEEILKASYNKVFDETDNVMKLKLEQKFNGTTPNFEEMAHFLQLEREEWTTDHKNLLNDLENKKAVIQQLEEQREAAKQKQQSLDKIKSESDEKLKDKVNNLEKNLEQLTISYQILSTKYANLKNDVKAQESRIRNKNEKLKKYEIHIKKINDEKKELKVQIDQIRDTQSSEHTNDTSIRPHAKILKKIKGGGANARVMGLLNMKYQEVNK
jgi:kinesin family member 5